MHKLLSARSPFWQLTFSLLSVAFISLLVSNATAQSTSAEPPLAFVIVLVLFLGFAFVAQLVVWRHNKKYPHARLSVWQGYPPELLDSDEMLTSAATKASKNVYLYNNYALPVLVIVMMFLVNTTTTFVAIAFGIYLIGYYGTFLRSVWPFLED